MRFFRWELRHFVFLPEVVGFVEGRFVLGVWTFFSLGLFWTLSVWDLSLSRQGVG